MFHLAMHLMHFYLWLYGVEQVIKDHNDNERRNPLSLLYELLVLIGGIYYFICAIPESG